MTDIHDLLHPPDSAPLVVPGGSDVDVSAGSALPAKQVSGGEAKALPSRARRRRGMWLAVAAVFAVGLLLGSRKSPEVVERVIQVPAPPVVEYQPVARDSGSREVERVRMEATAIAFLNAWLTRGGSDLRGRAMSGLTSSAALPKLAGSPSSDSGRPFLPPTASVADPVTGTGHYWTTLTDGHVVGVDLALRDGDWVVTSIQG